ncbi:MAG: hypothetical protein AB3N64_04425 [Puniceicoccaceae bacterium]
MDFLIMLGIRTSRIMRNSLMFIMLIVSAFSLHAVTLEFDQATYSARPGDSFDITVRLSEPVPNGLAGYALKLGFSSGLLAIDQIQVVPQLDFDLFEPGAARNAGADFASVAGFTEFGQPAYNGTDFVTFSVTLAKTAQEGEVSLNLGPLLANAVNFVDGLGNPLDDTLVLGTATLDILPPWPEEFLDDLHVSIEGNRTVLRFSGIPGRIYRILYSTTLQDRSWILLQDIEAPESGLVEVTDTLGSETRFYNVTSP